MVHTPDSEQHRCHPTTFHFDPHPSPPEAHELRAPLRQGPLPPAGELRRAHRASGDAGDSALRFGGAALRAFEVVEVGAWRWREREADGTCVMTRVA